MNVVLDTSIIVEIDRKNKEVIDILKKLIDNNHRILVSTISVSEILTGSYLRKDYKSSVLEAKRILGQFLWIDLDAKIAEKTAQYLAYLITEGNIIEYQDAAIAATFKTTDSDYLLTLNKNHFERIPDLKNKVFIPKEFVKLARR
ncbi:MAG: type II toxin-antitoxin system VapC family toxin [Candidatus Aenigmarchaeota archaeon]|nr:type II toxin-antitoxin system VapC family toxin [Candidatus Aenigmarchaeota archaeon]